VTYGFAEHNYWRAVDLKSTGEGGVAFSVYCAHKSVCDVSSALPGSHNVLNALAALVATIGMERTRWSYPQFQVATSFTAFSLLSEPSPTETNALETAVAALESYEGVARRMHRIGTIEYCVVYEDYAHHPTAIRAAIQAIRCSFSSASIVVAFQPHTFMRTLALLHDFADSLSLADRVIIMPVYGARTCYRDRVRNRVGGQDLSRLLGKKSTYSDSLNETVRWLQVEVQAANTFLESYLMGGDSGDAGLRKLKLPRNDDIRTVVLSLGAGSSDEVSSAVTCLLEFAEFAPR